MVILPLSYSSPSRKLFPKRGNTSQTGKESQAGIQHTPMQLYLSICRALSLPEEFLAVVTEVRPPLSTTQLPHCPRGGRQLFTHPQHSRGRNEPAEPADLGRIVPCWCLWHSPGLAWGVGCLSPGLWLKVENAPARSSPNSSGEPPACPVVRP